MVMQARLWREAYVGGINNIQLLRARLWKGLHVHGNTFKLVLKEKKPAGIWHRGGRKMNVS